MKRRSFLKQTSVMAVSLVFPTRKTLGAGRQSRARREKRDNTSRVPKYTFSDTLDEQEAQLKTNPLILRFKESRKSMAGDP